MAIAIPPQPPRLTANPAPPRPAGSVRRTSSIDVSWPDGEHGQRLFVGRVRDYLTPAQGEQGRTLEHAEFRARLTANKTITELVADPPFPGAERLVGLRGGNHLRLFIKETMPDLIAGGAPIYLALDDISGTALVSSFGHVHWSGRFPKRLSERMKPEELAQVVDVCWGLQAGNSGVIDDGAVRDIAGAPAGDPRNPADPEGWHAFHEPEGAGFRRVRRIDVSRDPGGGALRIDAAFQDSLKLRSGGRGAIHEYDLSVTADPDTLEILTLVPEPRILPFHECPGAIHNARRLIGSRLPDVRDTVLERLRGPEGCTHLNDALRALADVPLLAAHLRDIVQPAG